MFDHKCENLISAIDFFSQNLHLDQIVEYGFKLYCSIENPISSSIFWLNEDKLRYTQVHIQGDFPVLEDVEKNESHDMFAVRNGFILKDREKQKRYFDEDFLKRSQAESVMPLIVEDLLLGFIFTRHDSEEISLGDECLIRFNLLLNLALEKASRYVERENFRKELDRRIFNIDALSQTMRLVLSELSVEHLLNIAMDILREMTTSPVTSIGIYDNQEKILKIEKYFNVFDAKNYFDAIHLKTNEIQSGQMVFDYPQDREALKVYFDDLTIFERLEAEKVIFIYKKTILGFITLAPPLNEKPYDHQLIQRIEDLVALFQLGITNAKLFESVKEQRDISRQNFMALKHMNKMIKSINDSESMDEIIENIFEAFSLSFGVTQAFMIEYKPHLVHNKYLGFSKPQVTHLVYEILKADPQAFNKLTVLYTRFSIKDALGEGVLKALGEGNCLMILPIFIDRYERQDLGAFVITHTKKRLHETQYTMLETLSQSVAPVLAHLNIIDHYKKDYQLKPYNALTEAIKQYAEDYHHYGIPYYFWYKKMKCEPLEEPDFSNYQDGTVVYWDGYIIVVGQVPLEESVYDYEHPHDNPTIEDITSVLKQSML